MTFLFFPMRNVLFFPEKKWLSLRGDNDIITFANLARPNLLLRPALAGAGMWGIGINYK